MYQGYALWHREQVRSEHRTISLFCAIQCWINGWDGLRISRHQFEQLLSLQRFKSIRVEWIKQDFKELFPYQRLDHPFPSFVLSRRAIEDKTIIGECVIPERRIYANSETFGNQFLPTLPEEILDIFIQQTCVE